MAGERRPGPTPGYCCIKVSFLVQTENKYLGGKAGWTLEGLRRVTLIVLFAVAAAWAGYAAVWLRDDRSASPARGNSIDSFRRALGSLGTSAVTAPGRAGAPGGRPRSVGVLSSPITSAQAARRRSQVVMTLAALALGSLVAASLRRAARLGGPCDRRCRPSELLLRRRPPPSAHGRAGDQSRAGPQGGEAVPRPPGGRRGRSGSACDGPRAADRGPISVAFDVEPIA